MALLKPRLPRSEYCFAAQKQFLEAAFWYEYGRELARQETFLHWLTEAESPTTGLLRFRTSHGLEMIGQGSALIHQLPHRLQQLCDNRPSALLDWLSTPWSDLPPAGQSYYKRHLPSPRSNPMGRPPFSCVEITFDKGRDLSTPGVTEHGSQVAYESLLQSLDGTSTNPFWGVCAVDLTTDDRKIISAFRRWLTAKRKEQRRTAIQPLTGESFSRLLSGLGAYRIRKAHRREQLTFPRDKRLKYESPFTYATDFNAGAKEATKILETWCKVLRKRSAFSR